MAHYKALEAMLPAGVRVYLFDVPDVPTYPYVVLWGDPGLEGSESLDSTPVDLALSPRVTCVGATYESCLIVLRKAREAFNRQTPVVAGRKVHELVQAPLKEIAPDREVTIPGSNRPPIYAVDELTLLSEPA